MNVEIIEKLVEVVRERKNNPADNSYTCQLLNGGANKIIKKLGEENAELIKAILTEEDKDVAAETADFLYHLIVALEFRNVQFEDVLAVLTERFGKSGIRK
jgi:phosphoribosyl-ATP pyrophosphohydrolase/phosphoribosyl-ATP pyrophosphohydrolase/phosphoribosyl-AMP cyclohydrolase